MFYLYNVNLPIDCRLNLPERLLPSEVVDISRPQQLHAFVCVHTCLCAIFFFCYVYFPNKFEQSVMSILF